MVPSAGFAGPLIPTDSPIGFFTNVANRLLKTQSTLDLNRIQIYPTNQYTPSIHRLLQLTANIYDCTTNRPGTDYPYLPSVFRPLFTNDSGVIYICGYAEETGTNLLAATMRDLADSADRAALQGTDMVWGVPAVIGVKKGYPGFNKLVQQATVQITRRMQFVRPNGSNFQPVNQTNLMYLLSISNLFGVDAWNPYATSFPRDLQIVVSPYMSLLVTNEAGTSLVNQQFQPPPTDVSLASNTWTAYNPAIAKAGFQIPVFTNIAVLPNFAYSRTLDAFVSNTNVFETNNPPFWQPHWNLDLKARVCFAIVDTATSRIIDYVNLADGRFVSITDLVGSDGQCGDAYVPNGSIGSLWCTNRYGGDDDTALTYGMLNQYDVSLGDPAVVSQVNWNFMAFDGLAKDKFKAIDFFRGQFDLFPLYGSPYYPKTNTFNAAFAPFRRVYITSLWEPNDPLVHHTVPDLTDILNTNLSLDYPAINPSSVLGVVSARYEPWRKSRSTVRFPAPGPFDTTVKDPLIRALDYWDFPTSLGQDLAGLGQVHRGTPWQTVYLKAGNPVLTNWIRWTGNNILVTNSGQLPNNLVPMGAACYDASFTQPSNDWRLANLLFSWFNPNSPRNRTSPNPTDPSTWRAVMDGITILTNDVSDDELGGTPHFLSVGMSSNSPQAAVIASAIDSFRALQSFQRFVSPGDIFAVPELSTNSPWLNLSYFQLQQGISDPAYEAIPAQLLPLLRTDSIGAVSQSGGTFHVQFSGEDNGVYAVQVSTDLVTWTSVSTNLPTNGVLEYAETPAPGTPRRYYRSVLLP